MKKPHGKNAKARPERRSHGGPHKPQSERKTAGEQQARQPRPQTRAELYGFHAVREAWLNPERDIQALYATEQGAASFQGALNEGARAGLPRPKMTILDKRDLESLLPREAVHQGLALACSPLPEMDMRDIIIRAQARESSLVVILDQVSDPHNIGAILRSACAFGAAGLVMQRRHAPEVGGVLAKTACGALEHVPVAYETNLSRAIETLQEAGYFVYGLDERGETDIGNIKPGGRAALVLGAEGPGIRQLVKEHCDALVRLPMNGPMPSINVSNAAAVALYALSKP